MQSLKLPTKRDHSGQQVLARATAPECGMPLSSATLPLPVQLFQQAADSQLQLTGWLHVFNAGILNFTLIATAAFLRARVQGLLDRQSLWQIICEYVDDAGRNVAANGGHYVLGTSTTTTTGMGSRKLTAFGHCRSGGGGGGGGGGLMAPRLHITAEDDEDASMTTMMAAAGTGAGVGVELGAGLGLGLGL